MANSPDAPTERIIVDLAALLASLETEMRAHPEHYGYGDPGTAAVVYKAHERLIENAILSGYLYALHNYHEIKGTDAGGLYA